MKLIPVIFVIAIISVGLVVATPVLAAPNEKANDTAHTRTVNIPQNAVEIAPGVFHIGKVFAEGKVMEGIMVFHHKSGHSGGPGGGGPTADESKCYSFIAKGTKWKSVENNILDPNNNRGLNHAEILSILVDNTNEWELEAGKAIMNDPVIDSGAVEFSTIGNSVNGKNEIVFADINSQGTIAVTWIWGIFNGPPPNRVIYEVDQVYDDVSYDWSIGDPVKNNAMDFKNISMHEDGHKFGLSHPSNECTLETMYAFAGLEETIKRDLNAGDKTGIKKLY